MHWLVREVLGRLTRRITRRWFARFLAATARCRETQHRVLFTKLRRNQSSAFGRTHRFEQIHSIAYFRRHVPVSEYRYYAPYIERVKCGETTAMFGPDTRVLMFAMTSGTTAEPKHIPVTEESLAEYRYGWMLWGIRTYDSHHEIYRCKVLQLASDWDVTRTPAGIPCGSISGLTYSGQKRIVRERYCVPACLVQVRDATARFYAALRYSLVWPVGMAISANPTTLVRLAKLCDAEKAELLRDLADGTLSNRFDFPDAVRVQLGAVTSKRHPDRVCELERIIDRTGHLYPKDCWPQLQVVANWTGGSMGAYLRLYPELWGSVPVRDIGLVASEGRMTIPLEDGTPAGVLDILHQYYEFIPESEIDSPQPTVLEAHELAEGERYYILLTTSSGLYRYNIHDIVRCVGFLNGTPMLEFLNKGSHFSDIAGEKLSEFQVATAVQQSLGALNLALSAFTLAPCWADPPYYSLLVEANELPSTEVAARLAESLDRRLASMNLEYASKRSTHRLGPISIKLVPARTWEQFVRARLAGRGGTLEQYKHPCLTSDLDFVRQFRVSGEILPQSALLERQPA